MVPQQTGGEDHCEDGAGEGGGGGQGAGTVAVHYTRVPGEVEGSVDCTVTAR